MDSAFIASLTAQWKGRPRFVVLDDRFDGGRRFVQIRNAWRSDPHRCAQLHVITVSTDIVDRGTACPLDDEIADVWPPLTPNLHRLAIEGGRVQWLLVPTLRHTALRALVAEVDAFALSASETVDAHAARRQVKALARLARIGSTVSFDAGSAAADGAMRSAGFAPVLDPLCTAGPRSEAGVVDSWRYDPSFTPRHAPSRSGAGSRSTTPVLVIGAGLAGCAMSWALAEQGRDSIVFERHGAPAMETSGNPAGLFHGIVNPQDGAHARFNRAAALETRRAVVVALAQHGVLGCADGLLRLEIADGERSEDDALRAMQATLLRLGLPTGYVQALSACDASACSGLRLHHPAWWYPGGGWVEPGGLARSFIERADERATLRVGCAVESLRRGPHGWVLRDVQGDTLAESETVVLANAGDALRLLRPWAPASQADAWPLLKVRGQISTLAWADTAELALPRVPITGAGYLLPPVNGQLIFGATSQPADDDPSVRDSDHRYNLAQLARLTGVARRIEPCALGGRTGWRCSTDDRLPLLGAVPDITAASSIDRLEHPSQVPRMPGLYACTAFGSRGITWAALAAQVVASSITGAPMPIEAGLLDSVDAARFVVRAAARRSRRGR